MVDLDSALVCYRVESGKADSPQELADKDRLETYPTWSPDGKYLYFCSAPVLWKDRNAVPPEDYDKLKYDLRRIPYDIATDQWGKAETVLSAEETGQSILLPRISPDGRFLLFCMCRYGCFPVYQPSSDLYLMDLATPTQRRCGETISQARHQQRVLRIVAQLVQQQPMDRLQQQASGRPVHPDLFQLRRRDRDGAQALRPAAGGPDLLRFAAGDVQRPGVGQGAGPGEQVRGWPVPPAPSPP